MFGERCDKINNVRVTSQKSWRNRWWKKNSLHPLIYKITGRRGLSSSSAAGAISPIFLPLLLLNRPKLPPHPALGQTMHSTATANYRSWALAGPHSWQQPATLPGSSQGRKRSTRHWHQLQSPMQHPPLLMLPPLRRNSLFFICPSICPRLGQATHFGEGWVPGPWIPAMISSLCSTMALATNPKKNQLLCALCLNLIIEDLGRMLFS